jgi:hypothetical protein
MSLYAQDESHFFINDTGVRLRDQPGLKSNILRVLNLNEAVEYITARDLFDGSEYKWINLKTKNNTGWVYGEYVSSMYKNINQFIFIEDAGISMPTGTIYSGMYEKNLFQILGQPFSKFYDKDFNEDTVEYGSKKELTFLIHKYNQRIHHIIIKTDKFILTNSAHVGMSVSDINPINLQKTDSTRYSFTLLNRFKSSVFDTTVMLTVDINGIIIEIQIGLPE